MRSVALVACARCVWRSAAAHGSISHVTPGRGVGVLQHGNAAAASHVVLGRRRCCAESVVSIRVAKPVRSERAVHQRVPAAHRASRTCARSPASISTDADPANPAREPRRSQIAVFPSSRQAGLTRIRRRATLGQLVPPQVDVRTPPASPSHPDMPCDPTSTAVCPVVPGGRRHRVLPPRRFGRTARRSRLLGSAASSTARRYAERQSKLRSSASIDDFDTEVSVQPSLANALSAVSISEPVAVSGKRRSTTMLLRLATGHDATAAPTVTQPVPGWSRRLRHGSFIERTRASRCVEARRADQRRRSCASQVSDSVTAHDRPGSRQPRGRPAREGRRSPISSARSAVHVFPDQRPRGRDRPRLISATRSPASMSPRVSAPFSLLCLPDRHWPHPRRHVVERHLSLGGRAIRHDV